MPTYNIICPQCKSNDDFMRVQNNVSVWTPISSLFTTGSVYSFFDDTDVGEVWNKEGESPRICLHCENCGERFPLGDFKSDEAVIQKLIEEGYAKEVE